MLHETLPLTLSMPYPLCPKVGHSTPRPMFFSFCNCRRKREQRILSRLAELSARLLAGSTVVRPPSRQQGMVADLWLIQRGGVDGAVPHVAEGARGPPHGC